MKQNCDLEHVGHDGRRYLHRCRNCATVVRSHHSDPGRYFRPCVVRSYGPGSELMTLWRSWGIKPKKGCNCRQLAKEMNRLGPSGCREQRDKLLVKLRKNAGNYDRADWFAAAAGVLMSGDLFRINPLDPIGSSLDLAIAESEAKGWTAPPEPPKPPRPVHVESEHDRLVRERREKLRAERQAAGIARGERLAACKSGKCRKTASPDAQGGTRTGLPV